MKTKRQNQISSQIQRELAQILLLHSEEPIFKKITIVGVDVSPDLEIAKIFVSVFEESKVEEAMAKLHQYASKLRHALAIKLNLRKTPKLNFYYDESILRGQKLSSLIDAAIAADSKHSQEQNEA